MDIKKNLEQFKKDLDREIGIFFAKAIKEARKKDALITDALRYSQKSVLSGGKRLRPAIMYYSYLGVGGKEKEKILKTAVSIELIHAFLLMHDDIIDRDNKRHGIDTINFYYEKMGRKFFKRGDYAHFGNSMAIIIGDMIGALGNQIIFDSGFDSQLIMRALSKLQSIVSLTVIGQAKDIYMEYTKKATEKEILSMYEYKTARYTIEGPAHLGIILGGGDEKLADDFSRYAIPIGIAFQIQDDILGIFGTEKKLGKIVGSDIKEGKQTILLLKAKEKANREQKKKLEEILKKDTISLNDVNQFRKIIIETGSLEYAQKKADDLIQKGRKELEKINLTAEAKEFFDGLAEYMVKRNV